MTATWTDDDDRMAEAMDDTAWAAAVRLGFQLDELRRQLRASAAGSLVDRLAVWLVLHLTRSGREAREWLEEDK